MTLRVSSSKAFTLIETIITISLVLLVITLVTSSLFLTGKTITATNTKNIEEVEKMRVFSQMQKQLTCLYSSAGINFSLWGDEEISDRAHFSQIYFLTTVPTKRRGIVQVAYKIIKDDNGETFLGYKEFPYPAGRFLTLNDEERFEKVKWIELSPIFTRMEIEYYKNIEDNAPLTRWEEASSPQKIKVILSYETGKNPEKFSFSVFPAISSKPQSGGGR